MTRIKKAEPKDVVVLRQLAIETFTETFAHDNSPEQLQSFFDEAYSLPVLQAELADSESETYLIYVADEAAGFLKVNWGQAQTEQKLESAFEIQRIYILKKFQGQRLGKELFEFALELAYKSDLDWAWLGVWERNFKAQKFYAKYGFEKFSEHLFDVGDKQDLDWLLKKPLKQGS